MIARRGKYFYKLVCVGVDSLEYAVHEDVNKGTLDEVHEYVTSHFDKHPDAEWKLIPIRRN